MLSVRLERLRAVAPTLSQLGLVVGRPVDPDLFHEAGVRVATATARLAALLHKDVHDSLESGAQAHGGPCR